MSLSDVSEMIKNMLEQEDVPEEFCKLLYNKTRGNPFFVEEVVKSLKEEGAIYVEEGKWKSREISALEFPKSVKNIVKARFSRLDDECQNVLTLASFVGNDFTLEVMTALTGIEENKLLEIMDKLIKTGFVKHAVIRGEDICSFADIIMRDVVHEEVGPFKRKKLHNTVGNVLEKVYAEKIDEHLGELALHFLEGGDKDMALNYFMKAGEKAARIYANAEAASYFQSALRLLEEKEGELQQRGRVLERLGDTKRLMGEYGASIKHWNDALIVWQGLDEKETMARLHRKIASVSWLFMGETKKAKEHHEAAFKILEAEPESVELASLYEDMAGMVAMGATGDMAEALSWAEKAVELAEKLNAYEVVARSYMWLGEISSWIGERKKAVECFERALKIALDKGYMETAVWAYDDLAIWIPTEDNEKSQEYYENAFELAKKVGTVDWIALIGLHLANRYSGMGKLDKAVSMAEESASLNRKVENMIQLTWSLSWLGIFYEILGETEKSERCLNEAVSISKGLDDFQAILSAFVGLGWSHYRREEYAKAKELMEKGYEAAEKHGAKWIQWSQWIIRTYLESGEIEKARGLIDKLQDHALKEKSKTLTAYAHALRAAMLRAQKKWEESIEQFDESVREFDAVDARKWNMFDFADYVLYEYARLYLDRDQEGDREKAHNLLDQALEIFQKIGAKKDIEKVEARIAFIETGKAISRLKPTDHVSTGYADLDKLLCGGIRSSSAVVLTSPSCNERDSLIKSFLNTGAEGGEVTFYVTIDPGEAKSLAEEFPSTFHLFVCNPQAEAIVKSSPNIFTLKGVENLTDIGIALTSAIRRLDPMLKGLRRICIGLVSDVLLQHHAVQTRRWFTGLISELRSNGFTTLAVMDPEMHPSQEVRAVLDLFEGQIDIYEKETEKGLQKFLKIKRMSNQEYLENELLIKKEDIQKRK
jgi:tetratricopeptide (TPR) repeat protein